MLPNFQKISRLAHRSGKVLTSAKYDGKGKIPLEVLVAHSHIARGRLVTWHLFMLDKNISQKLPEQPFPRADYFPHWYDFMWLGTLKVC